VTSRCDSSKTSLAPVQELLRVLRGLGVNGVIPLRTDGVAGEVESLELGIADTLADGIGFLKVCGGHLQARSRGRVADEAKQHGECAQHVSRPSRRDLAEQAMLDGIPLRRSRRIVADGDFQPGFVREILESLLETPRPRRVAPAAVRLDHQMFCLRIIRLMQTPPVGDGVHGQCRRVARSGHAHMALVSLRIVNSVLRRATFGVLGKVVGIDSLRFFPPRLPDILEIAHQLLFLGVHADSRVACAAEFFAFFGDVAKLSISLGVRLARMQHLAMAAQAVALLPQ